MSDYVVLCGDVMERLAEIADASVQCVITSPPYYGLRDYGVDGQIGLEPTPNEYVARLVGVFREIHRVIKDDGTLWLNLGDSYAADRGGTHQPAETLAGGRGGWMADGARVNRGRSDRYNPTRNAPAIGLKHKDLIGIPWRVAFALRDAGWYLRSDIIWAKPNPMPESVTDRPTRAHEYLFLLTKSPRYRYDADAIRELPSDALLRQVRDGYRGQATKDFESGGAQNASRTKQRIIEGARRRLDKQRGHGRRHAGFNERWDSMTKEEQRALGANKCDVWWVSPQPFKGAHFATMPEALIEPCVLAGSKPGDLVLDPFCGSGRVGVVATRHGRRFVGIDLNPEYCTLALTTLAS